MTDDSSVFSGQWVRTYELSLPTTSWEYLLENARNEEYMRPSLPPTGVLSRRPGVRQAVARLNFHSRVRDSSLLRVYEFSDSPTFALIPRDYNIAMPTNQSRLDGVPHWSEVSVDCSERYPGHSERTMMA